MVNNGVNGKDKKEGKKIGKAAGIHEIKTYLVAVEAVQEYEENLQGKRILESKLMKNLIDGKDYIVIKAYDNEVEKDNSAKESR